MTGRGTCTRMKQGSAGRRGPSRTERQPVRQAQGEKQGAGTPRQTRDNSKQQKYQHRDRAVTSALATAGCPSEARPDSGHLRLAPTLAPSPPACPGRPE